MNIAKERISNPDHDPNLIVTYVSAIEGVLRSLVMWYETAPPSRPTAKTYSKYKNWTVRELYEKYLERRNGKSEELIPAETCELLWYAVEYRNLLVHECTYLGQNRSLKLISACQEFLCKLCDHAKIK